jgi:hypothetical protein
MAAGVGGGVEVTTALAVGDAVGVVVVCERRGG